MTDKTPEKVMESDSDDIDDNCIDTTMDETEQNDMKSQRPTLIIPQIHHHHHHNHNHHHTIASNHTLNNNAQQQLKRPALAIKSITGQTQFLVPVTTGQSYKKQQLLVMPHKKMVYLKQSSSSSSTMVKVPINNNNVNQNNNSIPLQQTQNTSSQSVNHHSTSILIRTSPLKSPVMKVPIVKSFYNKTHQSPKLTEKQMKDNFMESLGLVTKEALTELQSRRGERKRRTTANPQYSNAALEVKRIHNQEMAERRLAKRKFNTNNNNNHQMNGNSHGHSQMQHNTRNNSHVNNNYLNSPATSTGYVMEGKVLRPIIIEFDEISLDVHLVISLSNFANANCYECNELCECDCDSILYCKCCKTIFHATCADTIDDIKKNGTVHCPCCEKTRKQYEQLLNKRLAQKKELLQKRSDWEVKVNQMRDMLIELTQTLKKKQQDIELHVKEEELLHQRLELLRDTVKMVKETDDLGLCRETPSDEFEESHDKDDVNDDDGDYKENDESMDSETEKAAAQLEQMAKDNAEDGDDVDEPISSDVIHQQVDNDQLEEVQIYDLHCHESGIYDDIMVEEEVHESVMITDTYHTASDNNNSATIEFFNGHHQVSDDHHHVILY